MANLDPKCFLKNSVFVILAVSAILALFNFLMDPYLVFGIARMTRVNARKPAAESQLFLMKAYDALRAHPSTLILGSSSVGLGVNSESPVWPTAMRPVYNLGVPNGRPLEAYRYLQHVTFRDHPKVIILGVEFVDMVPYSGFTRPEYDSRLTVSRDGARNPAFRRQHVYDILRATLSIDASVDSIDTLFESLVGDSSDIDEGGSWEHRPYQHITYLMGSYFLIAGSDIHYSSVYYGAGVDMSPLEQIRAILDLCRAQRIKAILVMDPAHADELEIFDLAGKWPALEEWKRRLTTLVAEYANDDDVRAELWDFYGYDAYSTESVAKTHQALQWFLNPAHYTRALGDIMLRRMLVGGDNSFGIRLFPENIDSHLSEVRNAQASYRKSQPADAARVRDIYARAATTHSE